MDPRTAEIEAVFAAAGAEPGDQFSGVFDKHDYPKKLHHFASKLVIVLNISGDDHTLAISALADVFLAAIVVRGEGDCESYGRGHRLGIREALLVDGKVKVIGLKVEKGVAPSQDTIMTALRGNPGVSRAWVTDGVDFHMFSLDQETNALTVQSFPLVKKSELTHQLCQERLHPIFLEALSCLLS